MKTRSIAARHLVWLSTLLTVVATCPVSAKLGGDVTFYEERGFVVIGETFVDVVDEPVFDGCDIDKEIALANGQTFVCGENKGIKDEFGPDVFVLRHPPTGEIKVVIAGYGFQGTLQGTAAAEPTPAPAPPAVTAPMHAPLVEPSAPPPPGPKPLPPTLGSPTSATPPSQVKLIAPITGTWRTSAAVSGAQVTVIAMLDADGNFNRFERWSFGLTVQVWGTYVASPITPTHVQLSQRPTGWDPKEWCIRGDVCTALSYPEGATQFTFIDADTIRDDNTKAVYKRE